MINNELYQVAKPILFNTEMVLALIKNRKTVTRRAIKDKSITHRFGEGDTPLPCGANSAKLFFNPTSLAEHRAGDILYVRETFSPDYLGSGETVYKADRVGANCALMDPLKWVPSLFMPKKIARLFLRVTSVEVERLQDLNAEDIRDEGFGSSPLAAGIFGVFWDGMLKPSEISEYGWEANPWVWVYKFERVEGKNI